VTCLRTSAWEARASPKKTTQELTIFGIHPNVLVRVKFAELTLASGFMSIEVNLFNCKRLAEST